MNIIETNKRREKKKTVVILTSSTNMKSASNIRFAMMITFIPDPRHIGSLGIFHFYTLHTYEQPKHPFSVIHPIWADDI